MERPQSYADHRLRLRPLFLAAGVLILLSFALFAWTAARDASPVGLAGGLLALGALALWASVRIADIRLQDRVIQSEMRARWDRVLGASRRLDFERLTKEQVIALRFASDAELPALAEQALADPALTGDELKRRVREWQADHGRV